MSQMKNLHIDQMNIQCNIHDKFVQQVNESGLPLWMSSMYDNYNHLLEEQEEEEENQNLKNPLVILDELSVPLTEEAAQLLAQLQELPDECYDQQEEDTDYLCRLNGFED